MAQDAGDFQPNRAAAGKCQFDDAFRSQETRRKERQKLLLLSLIDAARAHPCHPIDHQGRLDPRALPRFPPKPVGQQNEALLFGLVGHVGRQYQGILQAGREDQEVRLVNRAQTQRARLTRAVYFRRAAQVPSLSIVAPQAESFASRRS